MTPHDPDSLAADSIVRTVCSPNCSGTCGVNAHVRNGRILKIEPADFPDPRYRRICLKGISMAMQRVHAPDRLTYPLRRVGPRGSGRFERIGWDEAFDHVAGKLGDIAHRHGPRACAWTTMTGNYGLRATTAPNRVANSLQGTWFSYLGLMGDAGCGMGYLPTLGVFSTSNEWADLPGCRLVLIFARNVADTAHSEMHFLFSALDAGAKLCVIDPRFSRTAAKADQWISPRPGTDTALILGMIHEIVSAGLYDRAFVLKHTNLPFLVREDTLTLLRTDEMADSSVMSHLSGVASDYVVFESTTRQCAGASLAQAPSLSTAIEIRLRDGTRVRCRTAFDLSWQVWRDYSPERAAAICEVDAKTIRALAREYIGSQPAAIWLGQGLQRYQHGHLAFRAAITLGALCGAIGRRHAGVNWSDGAMFRLYFNTPPGWLEPSGRRGHVLPGTRMIDTIAGANPYPIKSLWLAGYGFGTQSPNFDRFVREALPQLELFAITEQVMTPAAEYADIVLPCVSYYEDDFDLVPSAENHYVQLRRRAIPPVGESKNDYEIFAGVCARLGQGADWNMEAEAWCRHMLADSTDPVVRAVDWEELKREGVVRLAVPTPSVPFADHVFPTPSGRVELYTESLRAYGQHVLVYEEPLESARRERAKDFPLTLITNHPMHTVHSQHVNLPWIREVAPGPRLEMHPQDAAARGLKSGDLVTVRNDRGSFQVRLEVTPAVRPGSLNLPQGWWPRHFPRGHYQNLAHLTANPVQDAIIESNYAIFDNLVEVEAVDCIPLQQQCPGAVL
jgi:molybdopterin-containing oxidoreductase family molybdopterin binding subunit